ncbi:hypothetical protein ACTPOK_10750 [Streptomyces inhibens]|uniref:hypothetical protein n=1 Tax=Streptomyces inhibens TaxID=2293571 RepID=UPI00402AD2CA
MRPWDAAAPLVRAVQSGDALAMDDLLKLVTPYVTRLCAPIALADTADAVTCSPDCPSAIAPYWCCGNSKEWTSGRRPS